VRTPARLARVPVGPALQKVCLVSGALDLAHPHGFVGSRDDVGRLRAADVAELLAEDGGIHVLPERVTDGPPLAVNEDLGAASIALRVSETEVDASCSSGTSELEFR
jgi:hypothetical protein